LIGVSQLFKQFPRFIDKQFVPSYIPFVRTLQGDPLQGRSMPRNAAAIDTQTVLKKYNISSTNPKRWQDTSLNRPKPKSNRRQNRYSVLVDQRLDYDEDATRPADAVEDEEDPLGVVNGGIFK
jgi:hypothetical protein